MGSAVVIVHSVFCFPCFFLQRNVEVSERSEDFTTSAYITYCYWNTQLNINKWVNLIEGAPNKLCCYFSPDLISLWPVLDRDDVCLFRQMLVSIPIPLDTHLVYYSSLHHLRRCWTRKHMQNRAQKMNTHDAIWFLFPGALGLFPNVLGLLTSCFSLARHTGNHQGCIVVSSGWLIPHTVTGPNGSYQANKKPHVRAC